MTIKVRALFKAVRNILGVSVVATILPSVVLAQVNNPQGVIEEVYVTGSSIKRSDLDGALPVQVLTSETIARSGVTSVPELMAKLPAMQGFTTASDSVGGDGGGIKTANLRDLGSQYTLVLLNGRRLAPANSSSTIDLSNIPLSAVERVEVLTDGASALYGSDAIAGVVNFILKSSVDDVTISARYDKPKDDGGETANFAITGGIGDFDNNGFNIVVSFSHDEQEQLTAADRDFAKTGIIEFDAPGYNQRALFFNGSGNSIPGNVRVKYNGTKINPSTGKLERLARTFSPYRIANNGACPKQTSPVGAECWFDYTSTIEILPEYERNSIFTQANINIADDLTAFVTLAISSNEMTTRIAPYPSGYVRMGNDSKLAQKYVIPNLSAIEQTHLADGNLTIDGRWRALPAGNRVTEWNTDTVHFVSGFDGAHGVIDYSGALTYSNSETEQNYPTGWLMLEPFKQAIKNGDIDIFTSASELTPESQAALDSTIYHGNWDTTRVEMIGFDTKGSMPLFDLPGGEAQIAIGFDFRSTEYDRDVAAANTGEKLLFLSKDTAYLLERMQYGLFSELLMPVIDNVEVTLAARYDEIGAVEDKLNGGDINDSESDLTYKISARWNVTDAISLRASYGTGFKAPSMREIGAPRSDYGVTSGTYACPFSGSDPLASICLSNKAQYGIYREGNPELVPETSTQYTFGTVFAPSNDLSITVDYWNIEMEDLVERITEQQLFANGQLYREYFTSRLNLSTGENELAIIQQAVNVGKSENSGVDYAVNTAFDLGLGQLTVGMSGTYFIESDSSLTGSSLGKFGNDNRVTFRNIAKLNLGFDHDIFSHSVVVNFRSGYTDQRKSVNLLNDDGSFGEEVSVQLEVPSYTTVDYQSQISLLDDGLGISFGIKNLFDREPPLTLRTGGAGHQIGWDPRYSDPYGQTFYLEAKYAF